jgi:hypothetical protein
MNLWPARQSPRLLSLPDYTISWAHVQAGVPKETALFLSHVECGLYNKCWQQVQSASYSKRLGVEREGVLAETSVAFVQLNQATLRPRRDYTTNRLVTAELQAAPGTLLLLDEISLQSGALSALGLDNLKVRPLP